MRSASTPINAGGELNDHGRCGENPVGENDFLGHDANGGDVFRAVDDSFKERSADSSSEQHCRRDDVSPLRDQINIHCTTCAMCRSRRFANYSSSVTKRRRFGSRHSAAIHRRKCRYPPAIRYARKVPTLFAHRARQEKVRSLNFSRVRRRCVVQRIRIRRGRERNVSCPHRLRLPRQRIVLKILRPRRWPIPRESP